MTEEKKEAGEGGVKDLSKELKEKIKLALGVPLKDIPGYSLEQLVGELVETVLLVDDDGIVTELNHLRGQLRRTQTELQNLKKRKGLPDTGEEEKKEEEARQQVEEEKRLREEAAVSADRLRKVEKELKDKEQELERLQHENEENSGLLNEGIDLYDRLLAEKNLLQERLKLAKLA